MAIKRDNYFNISKVYKKRTPPNLPFRKGEELKTPSLFEKGGLGWVKKNYRFITAGLIVEMNNIKSPKYYLKIFLFLSLYLIFFSVKCSTPQLQNNYPLNNFSLNKNIVSKGKHVTSTGKLKALFIFAMFKDDSVTKSTEWNFNKKELPGWTKHIVNNSTENIFPYANLTHYYYEMSRGNFLLYGDVYPKLVIPDSNENKYKTIKEVNTEILKKLDNEIDFSEYDNWGKTKEGKFINKSDGIVDMIFIVYRNFSNRLFYNQGWTGIAQLYLTKPIKTNDGVIIKNGVLSAGSGVVQRAGKHGFTYTKYILAHEFAHFLFGSGHLRFTSNLSLLIASLWNESRGMHSWERAKLGWINFKDVSLNKNTVFTLDDYITTGDVLRIPINKNEWYLIENHQRISPNDWAQDKGIFIFHVTGAKRFPPSITNECADGNWDFKIDTKKRKLYKTIPNKKGKNETNFFKRKNGTNYACYEEVYEDNSAWGDNYDAYDLTYNNIFSPVSNPPVKNYAEKKFAIQIKKKTGNKYKLGIFFNDIYKNTPPSKPQITGLKNIKSNIPCLEWYPNEEPDLLKYAIFRTSGSGNKLIGYLKNKKPPLKLKLKKLNRNSDNFIYIIAIDKTENKSLPSNLISIKWDKRKNEWQYKLLEKNSVR